MLVIGGAAQGKLMASSSGGRGKIATAGRKGKHTAFGQTERFVDSE